MVEMIRGYFGECCIRDCMDRLTKLEDKSIDLIFTDTLWGHDYQDHAQKPMGINQKADKQDRIPYEDKWNPEFHMKWFTEAQRVSHAQVLCVGRKHKKWWINTFDPIDWIDIYYKNGQGSTKVSRYSAKMEYFCFGEEDWWKQHKFHRDVVETYIHNGFLRDNEDELKHPSPKDFDTWKTMLEELNDPKILNVYDPFAGSCAIGEVSEALGINWVADELKPDYLPDIELRIRKGRQWYLDHRGKQRTLL